jgi:nucleoside phosphorylase
MPAERAPVAILTALPEESRPLLRRLTQRRSIESGRPRAWTGRLAGREVIVVVTGAGALAA